MGQFFTTNAKYIFQGLLKDIPNDVIITEPFVGNGDLLSLKENKFEIYDLDPKIENTIKQDSLLNPINYKGRWVLTNPPYLARNKNKNKEIYDKYQTDDLYKAFLKIIAECEGGAIILPVNFFSGDDKKIREYFLSNFVIKRVNIFEENVFEDTTYSVCSFSFVKKQNEAQDIEFNFFPSNKKKVITLEKEHSYTIGNEIYNLKQSSVKIGRLLKGGVPNSNIFLNAIDTGTESGKIKLSLKTDPFYGKNTDRAFATLIFNKKFSIEEQRIIVENFNNDLNLYRDKYNSLFLTNYRNSTQTMARKRIGFNLAYKIVSNVIYKQFQL